MTPAGASTVVWTLFEEPTTTVQASTRPVGGEFSTPEDLSAEGEGPESPALAISAGGDALVAWSAANGTDQVARAALAAPGGGFGDPADLSTPSPAFFHPAPAIGSTGDATVVWTRSDGANDIVQAAGFDADPPLLRSVSIPARGEVGVPVGFSADSFDVWPISSTGFSFGDGGTAEGNSVSHVYSAPGTFQVTVTARDAAGTPTSASGTIAIAPSYDFRIEKRKRNLKRGVVTLTIAVPGPGRVAVSGKSVKRAEKRIGSAGRVSVPVAAKGKALRQLRELGKARVRATVTFRPDGGTHAASRFLLLVLVTKPQGTPPSS